MRYATAHPIFDTTWASFGALLIVVGAVLVIADVLSAGASATWGGTYGEWKDRMAVSVALVGSLMVAAGSLILLLQGGVSLLGIVVVLVLAAAATWVAMAFYLKQHLDLWRQYNSDAPRRSVWWCLRHPFWRPSEGP